MVDKPILKTPDEIEKMRAAGAVVAEALRLAEEMSRPGVSTLEIDAAVEALIRERNGVPSFLGYPAPSRGVQPFPGSICASVNEEVVHGIPDAERKLADGDLFSVDVGVILDGYHGDAARTFAVGEPDRKAAKLLEVGRETLRRATKLMKPGVRLSRISAAIQKCAEENRFSVVRKFVGHGIGREMHEPPQVPNFVPPGPRRDDITLETGTVLAIEPMVNAGGHDVRVLRNGWTVVTADRKPSVHFENTIAVGPEGPIELTA